MSNDTESGPDPLPPASLTTAIAPEIARGPPPIVPTDRDEWREHLVSAEQKSQEDLDKALLSLSGGALGVSLIFLKDVIGQGPQVKGRSKEPGRSNWLGGCGRSRP